MIEDWRNGGFGLYIHWPFCAAKCPYCDFNSHVSQRIDQRVWRDAYLKELARTAEETPGRVLNSVFFGGGTPSLMDPDVAGDVIDAVKGHWQIANDLEVTLEANPTSVEAGRFAAFRDAGVNRVSLGVQALNDPDLVRLGRQHDRKEALAALDVAHARFERVSFDLIYARQDQTLLDWRAELTEALSLATDHLSLYQLTIEQGTAFGDRYARGRLRGLPDEDLGADLYDLTQELCSLAGLARYEVSNHAREGAQSRHNLIYWRYGDYVGIGPGAHGRLTLNGSRWATECYRQPGRWLDAVKVGSGESLRTPLAPDEQATEYLLMGLRLGEGIDLGRFARLSGDQMAEDRLTFLAELEMIERHEDKLFVTDQGFNVLNAVIEGLLPDNQ